MSTEIRTIEVHGRDLKVSEKANNGLSIESYSHCEVILNDRLSSRSGINDEKLFDLVTSIVRGNILEIIANTDMGEIRITMHQ